MENRHLFIEKQRNKWQLIGKGVEESTGKILIRIFRGEGITTMNLSFFCHSEALPLSL